MASEKRPPGNLQSGWSEPFDQRYRTVLSRTLSSLQTLFMVINLVLGTGYFQNTTYAINVAGVGGAILAVCLVGLVVCCVIACLSTMIEQFPVSNAKVEFVHAFLDEELAQIIGWSYWLAYAAFFSALITSAVNIMANMVQIPEAARSGITVGILCLLVAANFARVRTFGYIELVMGSIKLGLVATVCILVLYTDSSSKSFAVSVNNFGSDGESTRTNIQAIFVAASLYTYSFIGIEAMATMSFETLKPSRGLRKTKYIGYMILVIYIILTILMGIRLPRAKPDLAVFDYQGMGGVVPLSFWPGIQTYSMPATTVLLAQVGFNPNVLNGFYVFSAVSTGNAALYVASRTLFGIMRRGTRHEKVSLQAFVSGVGHVLSSTRVPGRAIIISCLCFVWVAIAVAQSTGGRLFYIAQTLDSMAISTCILVWASQCMAYLRYHHWQTQFNHDTSRVQSSFLKTKSLSMSSLQPLPAWVGLVGCLCLALIFNGATLWSTKVNFATRFCGAYLSPIIMGVVWLTWKLIRMATKPKDTFHWIVRMKDDSSFRKAILRLRSEIYPTDYSIREPTSLSKSKATNTSPRDVDEEGGDISVVDSFSRSNTESSGATADREPEVSRISDVETVDREPALAGPLSCSPRSTMAELVAHLGKKHTQNLMCRAEDQAGRSD